MSFIKVNASTWVCDTNADRDLAWGEGATAIVRDATAIGKHYKIISGAWVYLYDMENVPAKDDSGGFPGLTLFKINFKNVANTVVSFFTNSNTAARTYTFQNRSGTIADDTDLALKANLISPSFTTPNIGAATGTSLLLTGQLGYSTGAGGAVTQLTSRTTGVTLNKLCGTITMFSSVVGSDASDTFTFTNSFIALGDMVHIAYNSTGNSGAWVCEAISGSGSATVTIKNISTAPITEATRLKFIVLKAVTS